MKTYQDDEIPKHRKKGGKRPWKITWTYIGPPYFKQTNVKTGEEKKVPYVLDLVMKSFIQPWTQRYKTKRAAEQALEAWKDGKTMNWKSPKHWRAEISCDE